MKGGDSYEEDNSDSRCSTFRLRSCVSIFCSRCEEGNTGSRAYDREKEVAAPVAEMQKVPAKVKQVTGEVKAVDTKAMTLTVTKKMKTKAEDTMVTVNDKTRVMMGKDKKLLADLKVGDKVTVKYSDADGKMVAKSIAIKTEEKKAEAAMKPAETKAAPVAKPAEKR